MCVVYFKTWSRRSLYRLYRRAEPCGNQSDVYGSQRPRSLKPKFETKIHRSIDVAQARNWMRIYCFGINLRLTSVIIFGKMVYGSL